MAISEKTRAALFVALSVLLTGLLVVVFVKPFNFESAVPTPTASVLPGESPPPSPLATASPPPVNYDHVPTNPMPPVIEGQKTAYLTFDSGPSGYTEQVLDVLKSHDVHATFFVVGTEGKRYPTTLRRIAQEGHVVANHTYSNVSADVFSNMASFELQLTRAEDELYKVLGDGGFDGRLLRLPEAYDPRLLPFMDKAISLGYDYYFWNVYSGDLGSSTSLDKQKAQLLQEIEAAGEGDIIIQLHDHQPQTMTALTLPWLIQTLTEQGYTFGVLHSADYIERQNATPTPPPVATDTPGTGAPAGTAAPTRTPTAAPITTPTGTTPPASATPTAAPASPTPTQTPDGAATPTQPPVATPTAAPTSSPTAVPTATPVSYPQTPDPGQPVG